MKPPNGIQIENFDTDGSHTIELPWAPGGITLMPGDRVVFLDDEAIITRKDGSVEKVKHHAR